MPAPRRCYGSYRPSWDATAPCGRPKGHHGLHGPDRPPPAPVLEAPRAVLADFDGSTYRPARDHARLGAQLVLVRQALADGQWHTLAELRETTGAPEASVSARIRDLRKPKFGGAAIDHENVGRGLWRYRMRP